MTPTSTIGSEYNRTYTSQTGASTTCSVLTFHRATGVTGVTLHFGVNHRRTLGSSTVSPIAVYGRGEHNHRRRSDFFADRRSGATIFARISWLDRVNYDPVHAFRWLTHTHTHKITITTYLLFREKRSILLNVCIRVGKIILEVWNKD